MKKRSKFFLLAAVVVGSFTACEDPIEIGLPEGESQLVVDALITTEPGQEVFLSQTLPYFANQANPPVSGAEVKLVDVADGFEYVFQEVEPGVYRNDSIINDSVGEYHLTVDWNELNFRATSELRPVPPIDTISFFLEDVGVSEIQTFAEYFATDVPNSDDFYWILYTRNDILYNDPTDFATSQNGAFGGTSGDVDGGLFILPIRQLINGWEDGYQVGDNLDVEIRSITEECFDFLNVVQVQADNANQGLFATPSANIPSNIQNLDVNSDKQALGFFNLSNVSKRNTIVPEL